MILILILLFFKFYNACILVSIFYSTIFFIISLRLSTKSRLKAKARLTTRKMMLSFINKKN